MFRMISPALAAAMLWLVAQGSSAVTLQVDPASQVVALGDPVSVDVNIFGLIDAGAPSLGTFDIDFSFDSNLLSVASIDFGTQLDILGLGSIQGDAAVLPGTHNVFEITLDTPLDLNTFQLGAFRLFTINFDTLAAGSSQVLIENTAILGDENGNPLSVDETLNGLITIEGPIVLVPAPTTLALLIAGAVIAARGRRARDRYLCAAI